MTLREYEYCTPYEFRMIVNGYNKRREEEYERLKYSAWINAKLTVPKVPDFDVIFTKKSTSTKETEGYDSSIKMHALEIKEHFEQFRKGGCCDGYVRGNKL